MKNVKVRLKDYSKVITLLAILLSACAPNETIRLNESILPINGSTGILWSYHGYTKDFWERVNWATVIAVDDVKIHTFITTPPIELLAGKHKVTIKYDKDWYFCSWGGCIKFEQTIRSLELFVEADHCYIPVARKFCNKDWIWIVDSGRNAQDDVKLYKSMGTRFFSSKEYDSLLSSQDSVHIDKMNVVAGERPPDKCDE